MLLVSSIKKLVCLALAVAAVLMGGCVPAQPALISLGDWISTLNEQAGIYSYSSNKPYYMNIDKDSVYFKDVQAAVEWQILDPSYPFDPGQALTKEWMAYTLMNLSGKKAEGRLDMIKDIQKTSFPEHVSGAVASGLLELDDRGLFHPKEEVEQAKALKALSQTIEYINHKTIEDPHTEVIMSDEPSIIEATPLSQDLERMEALFEKGIGIKEGGYVHWIEKDGQEKIYMAAAVSERDDGLLVDLATADLLEITESISASGEYDLDFSNAEIHIDGETNDSGAVTDENLMLMSIHPYTKNFTVGSYNVSVTSSSSGVKATATKKLGNGATVEARLIVSAITVAYDWNTGEKKLKDSYFRVSFNTNEDFTVKAGGYKELYGDFSALGAEEFLAKAQGILKDSKKDVLQETLNLCTVKLPMPGNPELSLDMKLQLNLYASGRAQIALSQSSLLGCEVRNGKMRLIKDLDNKADASLRGSSRLTADVRFGLSLFSATLMDAAVEAGANMTYVTTLHLYDKEGNKNSVVIDGDTDMADELAQGNPDVLVCGDLTAFWEMALDLNSSESLAGKLGLDNTFEILNEKNAPLFPGLGHHIENLQFVDHCTRTARAVLSEIEAMNVASRICLDKYSVAVHVGESRQINITGLPEGYLKTDLVYSSDDASIATVDAHGIIHAIASGSTVIRIATSDGEHSIACNVLVPMVIEDADIG